MGALSLKAGGWTSALNRFEGFCARLGQRRSGITEPPIAIPSLLLTIVTGAAIFGAVMGTFMVSGEGRWPLVIYAAAKVPTLILLTTALCLPAFFVLSTVLGLRDDFGRSVRAVLAGQATLALALASLSPLTRVAYESGISHGDAQLFNAGLFVLATSAGQLAMLGHYRAIIAANPAARHRHRTMLVAWVTMYVFTGIQTGWILRPYIGAIDLDVRFFRVDAFTNAYEYFLRLVFAGGTHNTGSPY